MPLAPWSNSKLEDKELMSWGESCKAVVVFPGLSEIVFVVYNCNG